MDLRHIAIFLLLATFTACSQKEDQSLKSSLTPVKADTVEVVEGKETELEANPLPLVKTIYYREQAKVLRFDTLIDNRVKLSIIPKYLDSYVGQEWMQGDTLFRESYLDIAYKLVLQNEGNIILDTVFTKQAILDEADTAFLRVAHFQGYWLDQLVDGKELVIFGNICQPETDWCLFFNHRIDTETGEVDYIIPEIEDQM